MLRINPAPFVMVALFTVVGALFGAALVGLAIALAVWFVAEVWA